MIYVNDLNVGYKSKNVIKKLNVSFQSGDFCALIGPNGAGKSTGEQQRVIIARSLVQDTPLILMDEAFSHLDINHQIEIMHILSEINRNQHKTIILVSHNLNLVAEYCNRVVMLKDGELIADGSPQKVMNSENMKKLYDMNLQVINNPITKNPNVIYTQKFGENK